MRVFILTDSEGNIKNIIQLNYKVSDDLIVKTYENPIEITNHSDLPIILENGIQNYKVIKEDDRVLIVEKTDEEKKAFNNRIP